MAYEQRTFQPSGQRRSGYTPTQRSKTPSIAYRPNVGGPATYAWGVNKLRPRSSGGFNLGNLGGLLGGRSRSAEFAEQDFERQKELDR